RLSSAFSLLFTSRGVSFRLRGSRIGGGLALRARGRTLLGGSLDPFGRRSLGRSLDRLRRRRRDALENRAAGDRGHVRKRQRGQKEDRRGAGGELAQEGLGAASAENRLATGPAERRSHAGPSPRLQEDDQDEEDGDENVKDLNREFHKAFRSARSAAASWHVGVRYRNQRECARISCRPSA